MSKCQYSLVISILFKIFCTESDGNYYHEGVPAAYYISVKNGLVIQLVIIALKVLCVEVFADGVCDYRSLVAPSGLRAEPVRADASWCRCHRILTFTVFLIWPNL